MAEVVQEKSRGLKFAEQQLLRHGWEHGKGLGRAENGISEAIKVKVKCDKGGVGHKEGEQFTFHWWDHVFNKASSSLQVESDQSGIKLKKTAEEDEEGGMISNKKPRKATLAKAKLYGCFVKSATLLSGQEQPEPKASNSDDSSSSSDDEEEDQRLDLSSTIKLSDDDLMKACGGRTAHKGARHGFTMSAKLARLEQQEAEFMAKYGKKKQAADSSSPVCVTPTTPASLSPERRCEEQEEDSRGKKVKKKRSAETINELKGEDTAEIPDTETAPKKKKKKKKGSKDTEGINNGVSAESDVISVENSEADISEKTKKKHKKKKNISEHSEEEGASSPAAQSPEETTELHTDTEVKKKKKKKSSKHQTETAEGDESHDTESSQSELVQEEAEVVAEQTAAKKKRKKCKKDKTSLDVEDAVNEEALPPKKKKKKKSKE